MCACVCSVNVLDSRVMSKHCRDKRAMKSDLLGHQTNQNWAGCQTSYSVRNDNEKNKHYTIGIAHTVTGSSAFVGGIKVCVVKAEQDRFLRLQPRWTCNENTQNSSLLGRKLLNCVCVCVSAAWHISESGLLVMWPPALELPPQIPSLFPSIHVKDAYCPCAQINQTKHRVDVLWSCWLSDDELLPESGVPGPALHKSQLAVNKRGRRNLFVCVHACVCVRNTRMCMRKYPSPQ